MLVTLTLMMALSAPAGAAAGGGGDTGCCSYRKSSGEAWQCVEITKAKCEDAVKKAGIGHDQWHFTKGKKCAENKDCQTPQRLEPVERK